MSVINGQIYCNFIFLLLEMFLAIEGRCNLIKQKMLQRNDNHIEDPHANAVHIFIELSTLS